MRSILKRGDNYAPRSPPTHQPTTSAGARIFAEEARLSDSASPSSRVSSERSSSVPPGTSLPLDADDVDRRLERVERSLERRAYATELRLATLDANSGSSTLRSIIQWTLDERPRFVDVGGGRVWMALRLNAPGFAPGDIAVRVDRNRLTVDAFRSELHRAASGSARNAVTRQMSRRYLLPGALCAVELQCTLSPDGQLTVKGPVYRGHRHADENTSADADRARPSARRAKQVKFAVT